MTITYEETRKALAKSKARWKVMEDKHGEVPNQAFGGKLPDSQEEEEKAKLKESDLNLALLNAKKARVQKHDKQ